MKFNIFQRIARLEANVARNEKAIEQINCKHRNIEYQTAFYYVTYTIPPHENRWEKSCKDCGKYFGTITDCEKLYEERDTLKAKLKDVQEKIKESK